MITPFGEIPNGLASRMSLQEQHEWLAKRVPRRTVVRGLATLSGALVVPSLWTQSAHASGSTVLASRHLAYGGDPTTEMVLDLAVEGEFVQARVEATSTDGRGAMADAAVATVAGSARRYGRATLTGLTPGTEYTYTVLLDGTRVSGGTFRTAPSETGPFRFTAFGDQGIDPESRAMLDQVTTLGPLFHLVAGDLCYADTSGLGGPGDVFRPASWDRWLDQNNAVAGAIPWMSVPGNHEMEPGFATHGYAGYLTRVCPGGRSPIEIPVATSFRVGSVGFVGLDSNDVSYEIPANRGWTNHAQTAWLDRTLADLRAPGSGIDFVVVFLHHSPYSTSNSHASEGGVREAWVPLFDKHTVDLVISGHNHLYERTLPLRAGAVVGTDSATVKGVIGTTYVTAGGGGAGVGGGAHPFIPFANKTRVSTAHGPVVEDQHWSLDEKTVDHAVLCVDVEPVRAGTATLRVRAVNLAGLEIDHVEISRPAHAVRPVERHPPGAGAAGQHSPSTSWPWVVGSAVPLAVGGAAALRLRSRSARAARQDGEQPGRGDTQQNT